MGSSIGATFAYMSIARDDPDKNTLIMGVGPMDYTARQAMRRMGIQPYSINFKQADGTYKSVTFFRALTPSLASWQCLPTLLITSI